MNAEEISTASSHLSVAMTTNEVNNAQTTGGNGMVTSAPGDLMIYFLWAVVVIGVVGTAANALVLYALVASKQYKKHALIINQNALDLLSCVFLVVVHSAKLGNIYLTGTHGYWFCVLILSENFIFVGINGSIINLATISVDRCLQLLSALCQHIRQQHCVS